MALIKTIATQYGVEANYSKITVTNIDWHNKHLSFTIETFVSKEMRNDGKSPITKHQYAVSGDDFFLSPTVNVLESIYTYIKTKPEWENAIDD
jgi:hypothetical protein